jgi:Fe2+ transport system protein FeoA
MEMGLCRGVEIDVLRRAPLGDPIELRVRGYLLSLRGVQAALVMVQRAVRGPSQPASV